MPNPITVRDRTGVEVSRNDGVMQAGDTLLPTPFVRHGEGVRVPFHLADAARPGSVYLTDTDRHAFVRAKLGAAADGKCASFLDAAYRTLTTDTTRPVPVTASPLTDAQRAVAQRGVEQALADSARRQRPMQDRQDAYMAMCDRMSAPGCSKRPFNDGSAAGVTDAMRGHRDASYAVFKATLSEAWKGSGAAA